MKIAYILQIVAKCTFTVSSKTKSTRQTSAQTLWPASAPYWLDEADLQTKGTG